MKKQNVLLRSFQTSLPVMAGYVVLGMGFGMVLRVKGFGLPWAFAMSLFIYAGSMQFVLANLLAGGASLLATAATTLLVNARHLFYGISMIDRYRESGKAKPYLIFALTDETYSLLSTDPRLIPADPADRNRFYFLVSAMNHAYWILGSVLGSVLGGILPFDSTGIDFSLTALFITIVVDQWQHKNGRLPAVLGFVISIACLAAFGPDRFLIPAMLLILAAVYGIRGREMA